MCRLIQCFSLDSWVIQFPITRWLLFAGIVSLAITTQDLTGQTSSQNTESPKATQQQIQSRGVDGFELKVTPKMSAGADFIVNKKKFLRKNLFDVLTEDLGHEAPERIHPASPRLISTIEGINMDKDGTNNLGSLYIPPDPMGVAGTNHVVSVVNRSIEWYTKAGVQQNSQSLASFFSSVSPTGDFGTFDPKVIYDQYENRFVVVCLDLVISDPPLSVSENNRSRILLAVSDDSDPNGNWHFHSIDSKLLVNGIEYFADYPGFAVDEEAVYITANMFPFIDTAYLGTRLWIVHKMPYYSGGNAVVTSHDPAGAAGLFDSFTLQPAHTIGAVPSSVGTFLVSSALGDNLGNEAASVIRVDNPLGIPTFSNQFVEVGNIDNENVQFRNAPQMGSSVLIATNDPRALHAVWRDNTLWTTNTVVPPSGPDAGQATAHWYKIDTSNLNALFLADQGDVGGEDIAPGTYTFFPSVAVNGMGDMGIGFAASAPSIFPGVYFTGRLASDPPGSVQPAGMVRAGVDYYVRTFGGGSNRWGDYSGMSVDPVDDATFWVFNEYALQRGNVIDGEDGRWGTVFGRFSLSNTGGGELDPPQNLTASVSNNTVTLNWSAPASSGSTSKINSFAFPRNQSLENVGRRYAPLSEGINYSAIMTPNSFVAEVEPNNNPAQAQILMGDSPLQVNGNAEVNDVGAVSEPFGGDDMEDLFKVTTTAQGLRIDLDGFSSDCDIWLFDSTGSNTEGSSATIGATTPELIDKPNLAAGTYLIGVTIFDDDPLGPPTTAYTLTVTGQFGGNGGGPASLQSYNIYRSTSPNARNTGSVIGNVNENTTMYTDNPVTAVIADDILRMANTGISQQLFYYQVTAVYDQGESNPSNEVSAQVGGGVPLNPPQNLTASVSDNTVTLNWDAPANSISVNRIGNELQMSYRSNAGPLSVTRAKYQEMRNKSTELIKRLRPGIKPQGILQQAEELQNGLPVTGTVGEDEIEEFFINVPANVTTLKFRTSNSTGDPDIYIRFGSPPDIASFIFDYAGISPGPNDEFIILNTSTDPPVQVGNWYVTVLGVEQSTFTLKATYSSPQELSNGLPITRNTEAAFDIQEFLINVPADATTLTFETSNSTGDPDLFVRYGLLPDIIFGGNFDFSSESLGEESITIDQTTNPPIQAGNWYVSVFVFELDVSTYTLTATHNGGGGTANNAPVLSPIGNKAVTVGELLAFSIAATDPDGDPISLSATNLPVGANFGDNGNGTGNFSWTPAANQIGTFQVTFRATDNRGGLDSETISISVREAGGGNQLLSYNVYRSTMPNARSTGSMIGNVNANTRTYMDPALNAGLYYYQVTALYAQGESGPSNEASATVGGTTGGVTVTIPNVTAASGSSAQVQVNISGDDVTQILAGSVTFTYNESVINSPNVSPGGLLSSLTPNTATPGKVSFSFANTSTLGGEGTLALVTFNVVGAAGSMTPLDLTEATFNEGAIPASLVDGTLAVGSKVVISGKVTYFSSMSKTMSNVKLNATGGVTSSTSTGSGGTYSLEVNGGSSFTLTPSRQVSETEKQQAISALDATPILQYAANFAPGDIFGGALDGGRFLAADVTGNGTVSALDATPVLQFAAGFAEAQRFPSQLGQVVYDPASRQYTNVTTDQSNQDYAGVIRGDVTGNFTPTTTTVEVSAVSMAGERTFDAKNGIHVQEAITDKITLTGSKIDDGGKILKVPVWVEAARGMLAMTVEIGYEKGNLEYLGLEKGEIIKEFQVVANDSELGKLRIAMAGSSMVEKGKVLDLEFRIKGEETEMSALGNQINVSEIELNERKDVEVSIDLFGEGMGEPAIPKGFELSQNYPNPFNPSTTINFGVPVSNTEAGRSLQVRLAVYDVRGQLVKTLVDEEKEPGKYSEHWDGKDERGIEVASGIYIYRIQAGNFSEVKKMLILK